MALRPSPYIRQMEPIPPYAEGVTDESLPELRASDADRERTAGLRGQAAGAGRLTRDEPDERLNATYSARTHRDLEGRTADVIPRDARPPAAGGRMPVRQGEGTKWLISIMSGHDRKGRWLVG